jgi:hypothetical protein
MSWNIEIQSYHCPHKINSGNVDTGIFCGMLAYELAECDIDTCPLVSNVFLDCYFKGGRGCGNIMLAGNIRKEL